jgi:Holliday junction resolvase RusA-like endonuclease
MDRLEITLPFPPSVNSMFGGGSAQKRFPSKKYKAWLASCPKLYAAKFERCSIWYKFYFPDKRERDSQNYIKAATDFLVKQKVIINDDWKVITEERITPMGIDKENPRVEITILRNIP